MIHHAQLLLVRSVFVGIIKTTNLACNDTDNDVGGVARQKITGFTPHRYTYYLRGSKQQDTFIWSSFGETTDFKSIIPLFVHCIVYCRIVPADFPFACGLGLRKRSDEI